MRTPLNNPFSPGSDIVPDVWAGRVAQLSDWRDILRPRLISGLPERGRTILGEPGLGKSTLVRRIADEAEREGDWVTPQLRIPSGADPLKLVAAAILQLAHKAGLPSLREERIRDMLARVETVEASGFALTLRGQDGPEPYRALTDVLIEVGRAAIREGNVALIHIDEVQNISNEHALSQLLIALGDAITYEIEVTAPGGVRLQRALPIAVYLTGLPDFEDKAGARKGATFARRFKTTVLTGLDSDDLGAALQPFVLAGWKIPGESGRWERVRMTSDAAAAIVGICRGEPFLFQLAGQHAWYAGTGLTITREEVIAGWEGAKYEASSHIERIIERLPDREQRFIHAMAELAPEARTLKQIANAMGFEKGSEVGPTSQRLDTIRGIIKRGNLYTFRHRAVEAYLTSSWPDVE